MTAKKMQDIVTRLGGKVEYPACTIKFPGTFRLKNKSDALDLMDILINDKDTEGRDYTMNLTEPFNALRIAIKKGVLNEPA